MKLKNLKNYYFLFILELLRIMLKLKIKLNKNNKIFKNLFEIFGIRETLRFIKKIRQ